MKITDYKNEDALELLAEIIEPAAKILSDKEVVKVFSGKAFNKVKLAKYLLTKHSEEIVEIMAAINGVSVNEYEFNIITGTAQVIEMLNDQELISFFQSQGQMMGKESSGSVTETIVETEE